MIHNVPAWLVKKTFCIEHCPNCPKPWLVRLVGKSQGVIDKKWRKDTKDALGYGHTLKEAAKEALKESHELPIKGGK